MKQNIAQIIEYAINENKPQELKNYLENINLHDGNLYLIAFGKASWLMSKIAYDCLQKPIKKGVVITKRGYNNGPIGSLEIYEASHPIVDESSLEATKKLLEATNNLQANDDVIVLVSGGGSALLELPTCCLSKLQEINKQLVNSNMPIEEINKIRKQYSQVKGGKLAQHLQPAYIHNYILCDVVSGNLKSIASGPTINDKLDNIDTTLIGSCQKLALSAKDITQQLGYKTVIVDDKVAGDITCLLNQIDQIVHANQDSQESLAFIYAGEITLNVTGQGLGGRNMHLASACIDILADTKDSLVIACGSDGSDGPTQAAGGWVDSSTKQKCLDENIDYQVYLNNSDSYHLLEKIGQLIITGPTNTNVNDLYILLINR